MSTSPVKLALHEKPIFIKKFRAAAFHIAVFIGKIKFNDFNRLQPNVNFTGKVGIGKMAKITENFRAKAVGVIGGALLVVGASALEARAEEPDQPQQETIIMAANDSVESFSAAASSTEAPQLTAVQRARLAVIGESMDYAAEGYGKIGVSVLHGDDFLQMTGPELADGLALGIGRNFQLPSEGYAGDNGEKATEVTFSYLSPPRAGIDEAPIVMTSGPHNIDEALVAIQEVGKSVQNIVQSTGVNVGAVSFEHQ